MDQSEIEENLNRLDPRENQEIASVIVTPENYWKYGTCFIVIFVVLIYWFVHFINFINCTNDHNESIKCMSFVNLTYLSLLAGGIGAAIHALSSFALFAGKGQLTEQWLWWVYLRIPIGTLLALLVFLAMLSGTFGDFDLKTEKNIFFIVLACGLAGMFSKQVTQKLSDSLNFVFGLGESEKASQLLKSADSSAVKRNTTNEQVVLAEPEEQTTIPSGPDKTIQAVQERLITLGYLNAYDSDGTRYDDGIYGPVTRAAIEAYLLKEGIVGKTRSDTLGEECDPGFWAHLLTILDDHIQQGGEING